MTWVRLDDQFPEHPKVLRVGPEAAWLHVSALCYCARQLTDGFVPAPALGRLADVKNPTALAARLVEEGLWLLATDGWHINDYLAYNPSREKVQEQRKATAERKERWKERKRNGVPDASPGRERNARPHTPTRPGPKGQGSGSEEPRSDGSSPAADGGDEQFDPEVSLRNAERIKDELARLRAKRSEEAEAS